MEHTTLSILKGKEYTSSSNTKHTLSYECATHSQSCTQPVSKLILCLNKNTVKVKVVNHNGQQTNCTILGLFDYINSSMQATPRVLKLCKGNSTSQYSKFNGVGETFIATSF